VAILRLRDWSYFHHNISSSFLSAEGDTLHSESWPLRKRIAEDNSNKVSVLEMKSVIISKDIVSLNYSSELALITGAEILDRTVVVRVIFDSADAARIQASSLRCWHRNKELPWRQTSTGGGTLDQIAQFEFAFGASPDDKEEISVAFGDEPAVTLQLGRIS